MQLLVVNVVVKAEQPLAKSRPLTGLKVTKMNKPLQPLQSGTPKYRKCKNRLPKQLLTRLCRTWQSIQRRLWEQGYRPDE